MAWMRVFVHGEANYWFGWLPAALLLGADPKMVLDRLFEPVKKAAPDLRDIYLATGQLALDKGDFALAAKIFTDAGKRFKEDADMQFGLARALMSGSRPQALRALERAMEFNEQHIPSRLLLVDHLVDAEEYEEADKLLKEVLAVNANQPEAWAFRAVMAHLRNDKAKETQFRADALRHYTNNPAVDQLIGRKLSQKYRFAEGAAYQRRALAFDRNFLPAKFQLAQDLLRLGEEEEGWKLVADVHEADGYDVNAFNLVTLKDTTDKFVALTNAHFTVRMDAREAKIYGPRVLALLGPAIDPAVFTDTIRSVRVTQTGIAATYETAGFVQGLRTVLAQAPPEVGALKIGRAVRRTAGHLQR